MSAVMRYWVLSVAVLLGATLVVDCYGQPPGGGGRGGFGGGRGFGRGGGVAGLLGMEEVKKELKVTDEQAEEVDKLREEARSGIDFASWGDMSDEERQKAMKSMQESSDKVDSELPTILDPGQFKRLLGLYAQQRGADALVNKLVSKELGLSEETNGKLKAKDEETRPQFGGGRGGRGGAGGLGGGRGQGGGNQDGPPDFEAMRERMEKARKEREDALFGQITPEEKAKFEALKGEKFEFPAPNFGGGRGGPGGGGGRGGRRGGDNN